MCESVIIKSVILRLCECANVRITVKCRSVNYANMPLSESVSVQMCESESVRMDGFADSQLRNSAKVQICKCMSIIIYIFECVIVRR